MRKLFTLVLLWLSLTADGAEPPTILVLGDSLSAGYGIDVNESWTALLAERLAASGYPHEVINASISGETTAGGAARIGAAMARFEPELVVVELGANDGLRGFPPDRIRANLETIVTTARGDGADVVLLGIRIPANYGPRYREAFEGVFREVGSTHQVPVLDFFLDGVALDPALMQGDGIHPNAAAQPILLDNAWPLIEQALASPPSGGRP